MQRSPSSTRRRRGATMQDVADLLHISKQTVSAVINNKPGITPATRARVLAAIKQVDYRMDWTARSLRTGRTHAIALVAADVSSPMMGKMASAAEERLYAERYSLLLYNTRDDLERERFSIDSILERSVDGVLFVSARDESTALEDLEAASIPAVVIDRVPQSYRGPAVVLDNVAAGRLAAGHLAGLGHRHLAHIAGPANVHIARERQEGFCAGLAERGLPPPAVEAADDWHVESGHAAMRRLLARTQTESGIAFSTAFCAGDLLAVGALRALAEAGLRVPADVSLMGLDDIDIAAYLTPPLTTISQSIERMAALGVERLLALVAGDNSAPLRTVIEPRLVVRDSTAVIRDT
jgi:LacI family transcriptional regulator